VNEKEEVEVDLKRKDRELYEQVMHENAHANAAEEDKNSKFTEKIKTISSFVKEHIQTKADSKPKAMNEKEEKINKDIISQLEDRSMI